MGGAAFPAAGQDCPPEWQRYTGSREFLYNLQSGRNDRGLSEMEFKAALAAAAQEQVLRQAEIDPSLIELRTKYDAGSGTGAAIVFVDKQKAMKFYRNETARLFEKLKNALAVSGECLREGGKDRAHKEMKVALPELHHLEGCLRCLQAVDMSQGALLELQDSYGRLESSLRQMLADSRYGTVICLSCRAELLGTSYPAFEKSLKGRLDEEDCSLTDEAAGADWLIEVGVTTRKFNHFGPFYFAYADAALTVRNAEKPGYELEDSISVKGGHAIGYVEAARKACGELAGKIAGRIKEILEL